ncbi:laccase lcc5 [Armillaria luteobubalina]|uniref:Laccase lcc5 n=1 Tax=Armillaria luteobubalina TaxID=153913 RepID=A0AA39Q9Z0_9AGAR|nr:laccase lcc5 [Armillaria luteobubalina]
MHLSLFSLIALALPGSYGHRQGTIGPEGDLVISNGEVSPDGFGPRYAVLANSQIDNTLIRGNKGDKFRINVVNELDNNTYHWHGLFQKGTAWADGPAFVNQCPIVTGDSFLYNFDSANQAGTFWYHSHLTTQYCDGLRGPFIIYDPQDPHAHLYDIDDGNTSILTLSDWYHAPAKELGLPIADSTLINGLGRYVNATTHDLAVVKVKKGTRYRIRMINLGCEASFRFSIDSHTMTIIEVDGINHVPYTVDEMDIFSGQRYSFVLNANQKIGNYWIRANPSVGTQGYEDGINSAILRYNGADNEEPNTPLIPRPKRMDESELVILWKPLENPGAPGSPEKGGVDLALNLAFDFNDTNFTINGYSFIPPTTPVLLQILSGAHNPHDLIPSHSIYSLPLNSTIEISMPGGVRNEAHPFHLHGHTFDVVRTAGSDVYNYKNPVRRDVVNTGNNSDNVTIRFTTDNPGPWFLHCVLVTFSDSGFAIVFAEATKKWNDTIHPTDQWDQLCPKYDGTL